MGHHPEQVALNKHQLITGQYKATTDWFSGY